MLTEFGIHYRLESCDIFISFSILVGVMNSLFRFVQMKDKIIKLAKNNMGDMYWWN